LTAECGNGAFGAVVGRVGGCGEGAQGPELGELVEASEQKAGVDGASDGIGDGDGGDHRETGHLDHVALGQTAAPLGNQHDPIGRRPGLLEEGGEGQVARPPDDGEPLTRFRQPAAVAMIDDRDG